jgi:death-on-curing protein
MLAISRNHPFVQGNKRTGFVAGHVFPEFNGYQLAIPDTVQLADSMIRAVTDPLSEAAFELMIRRHVIPRL